MGFFGSKTRTYVSATTMPLVLGNRNALTQSVLEAMHNDVSVSSSILYGALNGMGVKLKQAYSYGQNTYVNGLPQGLSQNLNIDVTEIKSILEGIEGASVTINRAIIDYGDGDLMVGDLLTNTQGWDRTDDSLTIEPDWIAGEVPSRQAEVQTTADSEAATEAANIAAARSGTTVTGEPPNEVTTTVVSVVTESVVVAYVLDSWAATYVSHTSDHTGATIDYTYTLDFQVTKTYDIEDTTTVTDNSGTNVTVTNTQQVDVSTVTIVPTAYQASLSVAGNFDSYYSVDYEVGGVKKTWIYREKDGTYPSLDLPAGGALSSPFYPVVPLRINNTNTNADTGSQEYITGSKLLKKVGLDLDDLTSGIEENPDEGDIDHVFVVFGVQLQSEEKAVQKYLLAFFEYLASVSDVGLTEYTAWEQSRPIDDGQGGVLYYAMPETSPPKNNLKIQDNKYHIDIRYSYIDVNTVTGSIGSVGTVTSTTTVLPPETTAYLDQESAFTGVTFEVSYITFQQQISATQYKEVIVKGLTYTNYVYGSHTVETTLADSVDPDDQNFVIPLNYDVVNSFPLTVRNEIGIDGVNIIFNSYVKVKTKWYASGFFKFVITAVSLYFAGPSIASSLTAISGATSLTAAISLIAKKLAFAIVLNQAFKFIVKALGEELAFIISMVVSVYLVSQGIQNGSLKGVPWAEDLLQLVNGLTSGIKNNIQASMEDLIGEYERFEEYKELKLNELEEANELLETNDIIDPFIFIDAGRVFNPDESSEEFYNRTIHSGNIGAMALDAITHYVDLMLELPETRQMIDEGLSNERLL
ncbi:MAG: hypothetical protein ACRBB6_04195 [Neptuniibacter sp.]